MATLQELWDLPGRKITYVAKRPGGVYVSMSFKRPADAIAAARDAEIITAEDEVATDWEISEAP